MGPPCSTTLIPLMVDIENQPDSAPDDEAGGPLSMLLMPVVAAVDSARWAGRNIRELGRWVTRVRSSAEFATEFDAGQLRFATRSDAHAK